MASSISGRMLLGIRIVCALIFVGITYYDYRHEGILGVLGSLAMLVVWAGLDYSRSQGVKLAKANMQRYGLNADRDEAPPSV